MTAPSPIRPFVPLQSQDRNHLLARTAHLWDGIRGKRIFLSGGTGFVGCWLLESFLEINRSQSLGAEIHTLSRNPEAFRRACPHLATDSALVLWKGDLNQDPLPDGPFAWIIHGAVEEGRDLQAFEASVFQTRRMLNLALQAKTSRFLFLSSGAVYGPQPTELMHLPEKYPGAPSPQDAHSAYGQAKRISEYLAGQWADRYGLACTIARLFAFHGPYLPLDREFAVGNFIRDALRGGPIHIQGDGRHFRSYLYGADLAIWLWTILVRGNVMHPYHVGSDQAVSIQTLAERVAALLGPGIEIQRAQEPNPEQPAPRYVPCIQRARTELGLEIWIPLEEGLLRMAEWQGRRI